MSSPNNPLAHGMLDEDPNDLEMYGYDAQAPSPVGNSDNAVVVEEINMDYGDLLQSYVLERLDPLQQSNEMGVDIYKEALELVLHKIDEIQNSLVSS